MRSLIAALLLTISSFAQAETPVSICAPGVTPLGVPGCATTLTPVVSTAAENNHILKASPGSVINVFAANQTGTAGFLILLNSATSPSDGAVLPLDCAALPANGNATINYSPGPFASYSVGITAVLTSASTCFTKTTGAITGFIRGIVQ